LCGICYTPFLALSIRSNEMELSREDIELIGQTTAQKVLDELHRYAREYVEPLTIVDGLMNSMTEESTAAAWYRSRAANARGKHDEATARLYEHIAEEENQHHQEFKERLSVVIGLTHGAKAAV
jgi:rubrerythrin